MKKKKTIVFEVKKSYHAGGWPVLRFFVNGEDVSDNTSLLSKFIEETTGAILPEREGRVFVGASVTAIDILAEDTSQTVFAERFPSYHIHNSVDDIMNVISLRLKMVRDWVARQKHKVPTKAKIILPVV